jgi:hypothetical protein
LIYPLVIQSDLHHYDASALSFFLVSLDVHHKGAICEFASYWYIFPSDELDGVGALDATFETLS